VDRESSLGMDGWDLMGERRRVLVVVVVVERRSWDLRRRERRAAMKRGLEFSRESEENCEGEENYGLGLGVLGIRWGRKRLKRRLLDFFRNFFSLDETKTPRKLLS
jgi:hypothetical protein